MAEQTSDERQESRLERRGERQPAAQAGRMERRFALLKGARRIWAVAAIHAEADLLTHLHAEIGARWQPLDRIVYLGNLIGRGPAVRETFEELLHFRRQVLAVPHAIPEDVVYLRGSQEEIWQKLLQLQFARDPRGVMAWMLDHGVAPILEAYGSRAQEALAAARQGPLVLTRWTSALRRAMHEQPGHFQVLSELRRAALTDDQSFLFVHAGLDPSRPLEAQADSFWWGHPDFGRLTEPYAGFRRLVRGSDARRPGIAVEGLVTTLDGGAGFGGPLVAALLTPEEGVVERLAVGG